MPHPSCQTQGDPQFDLPEAAFTQILNFFSIPMWIEDFNLVKRRFEQLRAAGVADFSAYFQSHPDEVMRCAGMVKILDMNQAALADARIERIDDAPLHLPFYFKEESWPVFCQELVALANGRLSFESEIAVSSPRGEQVLDLHVSVPTIYADTLERVLVSYTDLTQHKRAEAGLRQSAERYRDLFENSPVGIAVSQQGLLLYTNPAYLRMFGFSPADELAGTLITDRVVPQGRDEFIERNRRREQGLAEATRFEYLAVRQDGSIFPSEAVVTTIPQENGLATLFFIQDITARKQAEEAELDERRLAEALADIAAALNRSLDFEQILDSILENVGRVLANDTVDIGLINGNNEVQLVRAKGYSEGDIQGFAQFSLPVDRLPNFRKMVETGQPVIIPNFQVDLDWAPFESLKWIRSYAGIPIRVRGKTIGFINLSSTTVGFYRPEHTGRLQAIADQVSIAFNNASLLEELRQANDRLQAHLSEIQLLQTELREQAIRDPLTNLFNRRYLIETLGREIERARRENVPVSIIVIDIDHFKKVNDAYGHKAGDLVLLALGDLLKSSIRAGDIACRYGGEEFVIVMPKAYPLVAYERAEQIRYKFEALRVAYEGQWLNATISVGLAIFPLNGTTDEEVLIRADRALYQAKQNGRNCTVLYENSANTNRLTR